MNELLLIRHGQAEHLVKGLTGGWTDVQLTALGRRQARLTGERLAQMVENTKCSLYTSDLLRTRETAEIISECTGLQPIEDARIKDLNNGVAAFMTREEAKKISHPVTYPIMDWVQFPGGESWRTMYRRVASFIQTLQREKGETAIIVSHSNIIISIIHQWLGFPEYLMTKTSFDSDPCSITHLRINSWKEKTIAKLNDTGHLIDFT